MNQQKPIRRLPVIGKSHHATAGAIVPTAIDVDAEVVFGQGVHLGFYEMGDDGRQLFFCFLDYSGARAVMKACREYLAAFEPEGGEQC